MRLISVRNLCVPGIRHDLKFAECSRCSDKLRDNHVLGDLSLALRGPTTPCCAVVSRGRLLEFPIVPHRALEP